MNSSSEITPEKIIRRSVELMMIARTFSERRSALKLLGSLKPELGTTLIAACRSVAKDKSVADQAKILQQMKSGTLSTPKKKRKAT